MDKTRNRTHNLKVVGSNPTPATNLICWISADFTRPWFRRRDFLPQRNRITEPRPTFATQALEGSARQHIWRRFPSTVGADPASTSRAFPASSDRVRVLNRCFDCRGGRTDETSLPWRRIDRRACVHCPARGAASQSIGGKFDGHAGPEPWRSGTDALQCQPECRPQPRRFGAVGSSHAAARGTGLLGTPAVLDVRHQFGDAAKAPRVAPCDTQGVASSQPFPEFAGQHRRQPAEPSGAGAASIGQLHAATAPTGARHVLSAPAERGDPTTADAGRRKGNLDWIYQIPITP